MSTVEITTKIRPIDAMQAMRVRGIDNAEELLTYAEPAAIVRACRWWDQQKGAGAGLLAWKVREGGVAEGDLVEVGGSRARTEARTADRQQRWNAQKLKFPVGSSPETHLELQLQRWPHDRPCNGRMVVDDLVYPHMVCLCDTCGFEAAYLLVKGA